jgi:SAM-dependent methyltransferase
MAALARRNLVDAPATIIESRFEDWTPDAPGSFDLAASATAFHWVDPVIGMQHVADALRSEGWLALWWMRFDDPELDDDFAEAVQPIVHRWDPRQRSTIRATEDNQASQIGTGLLNAPAAREFDHVDDRRFPFVGRHTASELRALWSTHSVVQTLPEPARTGLLDDIERLATERFGGVVERPYHVRCFTAQRR